MPAMPLRRPASSRPSCRSSNRARFAHHRSTAFSHSPYKGDTEAAEAPYANVEPLTADDVADCVLFVLTRPLHVNVDEIVIKALAQSSGGRIVRSEG